MIYNARLIYKNGSKYAVYYSYGAEGDRNSAVVICQYVALLQLIKPLHTDGKKGELVIEIPSCFVEDMENPMVDLEINGFPIQAQEICFRILRKDTIEVESYAYKKHLQNQQCLLFVGMTYYIMDTSHFLKSDQVRRPNPFH